MDTDDILTLPLPMGPHARASRQSRIQALKEFGINPEFIELSDDRRSIAHAARMERERILSGQVEMTMA